MNVVKDRFFDVVGRPLDTGGEKLGEFIRRRVVSVVYHGPPETSLGYEYISLREDGGEGKGRDE